MAQDPLKPRDDGRVRLPKIDSGMNKLPPNAPDGGKGAKDDKENLALGAEDADKEKILARIRKRMERAIKAESDNRKKGLEDLKFKDGDQWPADIMAERSGDKRPCLTINKMKTFVHQVTNDLRQNRPAIHVSPVGDRSDPEVAKMHRGLIRAIERDSHADIAYDTAVDGAASMGWGYVRLHTEYESSKSFDQTIEIRRVRNPFSVYLDPDHQEPDGSDAKWGTVTEMVPRDEFTEKWPKADPMPFTQSGIGESYKNWITEEEIRIAEYFEVETEPRTLVALDNGHVGWEDELDETVNEGIKSGRIEVLDRRKSEERKVTWRKVTAKDILEERDTVWAWVPLIKFIGDEIDIEGKVKLSGVVRDAKDPQRMYNYWRTLATELYALMPKAPYIGAEGQFEGHEAQWKQANRKSFPYLEYVPVDLKGQPVPPPQRQPFTGVAQGVETAIVGAAQDMMATTGIRFDASTHERMIDESGKAIRELRRSGDIGSFHYADNMARSLRHIGRMLIDAIPKVYDTKRMVTILREDDSEELVQIDPSAQKPFTEQRLPASPQNPMGKVQKIFNPTFGKYGVTVTIGPSQATRRIEATENMIGFAKAVPTVAPLIADLIAKSLDFDGAEEMAKRLAKALPPNLLTPDQKDIPPQLQAILQAMQAQIQQMAQERQQLVAALNEKTSDRAQRQDEIDKAFTAKMAALEEKFSEALIKLAAKSSDVDASNAATMQTAVLKSFLDSIRDAHDMPQREKETQSLGKVTEKIGELADGLIKGMSSLADGVSSSHKDIMASHKDILRQLGKPRKARLKRGPDGTMEVTAEFAEPDSKK